MRIGYPRQTYDVLIENGIESLDCLRRLIEGGHFKCLRGITFAQLFHLKVEMERMLQHPRAKFCSRFCFVSDGRADDDDE